MKKSGLILVAVIVCLAFIVVSFINVSADPKSKKDKKIYPIGIPRTGQTYSDTDFRDWVHDDDGELQMGVPWPDQRFSDNGDGTVTDNLTGLVWLKDANCFGIIYWYGALVECNTLEDGYCGLTDGSMPRDWRLPNRNELLSLIDISNGRPALPDGHPFLNVWEGYYWTSSQAAPNAPSEAWYIYMWNGAVDHAGKVRNEFLVWPVRSSN